MLFLECTHAVHDTPLIRLRLYAGYSSEASGEPLGHGIGGVYSRLVGQLRPTCGNVEA